VTFVYFWNYLLKAWENSLQQYNLGMGKVGKGGRGRDEGYGKWVELGDLPTLQGQM